VDYCIFSYLDPSRTFNVEDAGQKLAARHRTGDIDFVHEVTDGFADWVGGEYIIRAVIKPWHAVIFITGIPDGPNAKAKALRIRQLLMAGNRDGSGVLIRRRVWRIPPAILPSALRTKLQTTQTATVTWDQAKPYIRKKIVNVLTDATQDDETSQLTDADVDG